MNKTNKNKGLGRGLSALMSDIQPTGPAASAAPKTPDQFIPIEKIHPNPDQPRRNFDEDKLEELATSISERGIIQPIIVRPDPKISGEFQIVAGERRWRAAQIAQRHEIPALIREFSDTEVLEVAIIENIQRMDLNPVDEASSYQNLMNQFGHTQEQMASVLGKSRSHIANMLRLLNLPTDVLSLMQDGKLTAGHARALIGHEDASKLAQMIVSKGLSVRDAEKLAKPKTTTKTTPRNGKTQKDADTVQIERDLSAQLGLPVMIDHKMGTDGGKLVLSYKSLEQLDDLLQILTGS